jgi:phage gpG-like protein
MIQVQVLGAGQVVNRLKAMPLQIQLELGKDVGRLCLRLLRTVKESKLTGQVLHVRTGRLRRSIHKTVRSTPTDVTGIVGTNVVYAHVHEYGFQGDESVRGHLRTSKLGRKFPVRPFTRHVHFPERSFLRSTLREMEAEITTGLQVAVGKALRGHA